jgi:hypothetical protein
MKDNKDKQPLRPKSKIYLATFLNLLVWPGSGTFLVHRRGEAIIQVLVAFSSLVLLVFGIVSIVTWVLPLVAHADANHYGHDNTAILIQDTYREKPPRWLGFHSMGVIIFSIFLFTVSWIYSLVSVILAKQQMKKEG